jgi:hypothetical protein
MIWNVLILSQLKNWRVATMAMNLNDDVDEKKLNTIKLRVLEAETDNVVKKESKAAMIDKIYKLIMQEVDKK